MKKTVSLQEAKEHFFELAAEVAQGGEVIVTRNGRPLARLMPIQEVKRSRFFGMDRGLVVIPDDFDETPADFEAYT
jgi:prevent-host-death family protein